MKDYRVVVGSYRAKKDGTMNIFGGQGAVAKDFKDLKSAKDYVSKTYDDVYSGKKIPDLKTTKNTAYVEIIGFQPFNGLSDKFSKLRIPLKNQKGSSKNAKKK